MSIVKRRAEKWMAKNKQSDINYDIRLFDNHTFFLDFDLIVPAGIINTLAEWFMKRKGVDAKADIDSFDVDERLHGKVLKGMRKTIQEVEKKTEKDLPGFKFITIVVDKFKYKRISQENYGVDIKFKGDFVMS
ncbi:MAG: hypothetical protein ACOC80_09865 [Petrotogales bacterium]